MCRINPLNAELNPICHLLALLGGATIVVVSWLRVKGLDDLYCSPSIVRVIKSRRMRWAEHVGRMGEKRGVFRVLVWKPEGKRPLGRPRRRWEDNIKMDLQEWDVGVWTGSSWFRIGTGGEML